MPKEYEQINIRLSKDERDKIDQKAKEAGLSRTAFVKLVALHSKIQVVQNEDSNSID